MPWRTTAGPPADPRTDSPAVVPTPGDRSSVEKYQTRSRAAPPTGSAQAVRAPGPSSPSTRKTKVDPRGQRPRLPPRQTTSMIGAPAGAPAPFAVRPRLAPPVGDPTANNAS